MDPVKAKQMGIAFVRHLYKNFLHAPDKAPELFGEASSFSIVDEHMNYFGEGLVDEYRIFARGQDVCVVFPWLWLLLLPVEM